jgi:hypothetical protein
MTASAGRCLADDTSASAEGRRVGSVCPLEPRTAVEELPPKRKLNAADARGRG